MKKETYVKGNAYAEENSYMEGNSYVEENSYLVGKSLLERLTEYGSGDAYPFHMPGHKRRFREAALAFPDPFSVDITEIEGFDNLHHPEGILKDSMDRAAKVYGSDRSYYLVNGSTCGILSAICACVEPGERFLMARNSHKAAYHAVFLNNLEPVYVYPEVWEEFQIQGGISPRRVRAVLEQQEGIQAVFLTSPTYEGIVSDVRAIAKLAHERGIPLIVDEAHGAHFPFGNGEFPLSALECGADLVIQSLHKTLPSLTQTAILHLKSRLIRPEQVERYLAMFQSSSPSYVFLAAMENCVRFMDREGRDGMRRFAERLRRWSAEGDALRCLRVLPGEAGIAGSAELRGEGVSADERTPAKDALRYGIYRIDPSKIVVATATAGITGTDLADLLRERYHLEPEMACRGYVLYMTSLMDTEKGFRRLYEALKEVDRELYDKLYGRLTGEMNLLQCSGGAAPSGRTWLAAPVRRMSIFEAGHARREEVELSEAVGRVSGGFITVYPPGVPAIVPGEMITEEAAALIRLNVKSGLTVEGFLENGKISVVK